MTVYYAVKTLLFGEPVSGFPTLVVAILTLGGLNLMGLGVLGEYLGRLFMETKHRPLYLVDAFEPPLARVVPCNALHPVGPQDRSESQTLEAGSRLAVSRAAVSSA